MTKSSDISQADWAKNNQAYQENRIKEEKARQALANAAVGVALPSRPIDFAGMAGIFQQMNKPFSLK